MTKRKSSEERRQEIAETALFLVGTAGTPHVSTQAIADHMGVSQGTVFRHFKTRDEVFMHALEVMKNRIFAVLQPVFADHSVSADVRLKRILTTHIRVISENKGLPRLLFSDCLHLEHPALKEAVRQIMKAYAGRLKAVIDEGTQSGVFNADVDANQMAQATVTMMQGLVLRWSLFDYAFDMNDQVELIWSLLWQSLKPQP